MTTRIVLGDNISIGANSLVNKSNGGNVLLAGTPAKEIKASLPWYERDGEPYLRKVKLVESLKEKM